MKRRYWLVIVAVLALLGLPALLGIAAERQLRAQLDQALPYEDLLAVSIRRYDRGWFSSTVVYELGLGSNYVNQLRELGRGSNDDGAERAALAAEVAEGLGSGIELESIVRHGPVGYLQGMFVGLFRSVTTPGTSNPRINEIVESAQMPHLFSVTATAGFFGSAKLALSVPPLRADGANTGEPADVGSVRFSGLTVAGDYQYAQRAAQLSGGFAELNIQGAEAQMQLQGVRLSMDARAIAKYLWVGPAQFDFDSFVVNSRGDAPSVVVQAATVRVLTQQSSAGATVDMDLNYAAQHLQLADLVVSDAQLGVQFQSLSIKALEAYNDLTRSIAVLDQGAVALLQQQATSLLYEFAGQSPTVALTPIRFTLDGEDFVGALKIALDGSQLPATDAFSLTDLGLWSQRVSVVGSVELSKPLAERFAIHTARTQLQAAFTDDATVDQAQLQDMARLQAPLLLSSLVQQGMLREDNDHYRAELNYAGGNMTVNDQAIPIGALLQ